MTPSTAPAPSLPFGPEEIAGSAGTPALMSSANTVAAACPPAGMVAGVIAATPTEQQRIASESKPLVTATNGNRHNVSIPSKSTGRPQSHNHQQSLRSDTSLRFPATIFKSSTSTPGLTTRISASVLSDSAATTKKTADKAT